MKQGVLCFALMSCGFSTVTLAQPVARLEVPEALQPWVSWALDSEDDYGCTWVGSERQCVWPGELQLRFLATEGAFTLRVTAERNGVLVRLPGSQSYFPPEVRLNGVPFPIWEQQGWPVMQLPRGSHRIDGVFRFSSLPELFPVPPEIPIVSLDVLDARIVAPRRNDEGLVWLRSREVAGTSEGRLDLEVYRLLSDGVPFSVTTHIAIRAAGDTREVHLGKVVPPGMVATEVQSTLAVRFAESGALVAQVHAGSHEIKVRAVMGTPPPKLAAELQASPWPAQELWAFQAMEPMRQVEISGAPSMDPGRSNMPARWRSHPAYMVRAGSSLTMTTIRRGEPEPPPNQLRLDREFWLDLDGQGYTVRDRLRGTMRRGWRLSLSSGRLGHASFHGKDQLITDLNGESGVEIRRGDVRGTAEWRLEGHRSILPAVGWSEDVQELKTTVHVPPGWLLLGVAGADRVDGTWLHRWDLWGLLFVLLVSLIVSRMRGTLWGIVCFLALTLSYHEPLAPRFLWLFVMTAIALFQALAERAPGRFFEKGVAALYWFLVVALWLVFVPFAVQQLRIGLFPFTEEHDRNAHSEMVDVGAVAAGGQGAVGALGAPMVAEERVDAALEDAAEPPAPRASKGARDGYLQRSRASRLSRLLPSDSTEKNRGWIDPNAVIQTGPGVPTWRFRSFEISWAGPVDREHSFRLFLVPPAGFRLIAFLRVFLLALLLYLVVVCRPRPRTPSAPGRGVTDGASGSVVPSAVVLLTAFFLLAPAPIEAQRDTLSTWPSESLLDELRTRLLRPPPCAPHCAIASDLSIEVGDKRIEFTAHIQVPADSAYRLPGPSSQFVPDSVSVDGKKTSALSVFDEGAIYLRLPAGVHQVVFGGPIRTQDTMNLTFGHPPRNIRVQAPSWEVEGVRADGTVAESIQLRRRLQAVEEGHRDAVRLPPWVVVERQLEIGVLWTVRTTVRRITPVGDSVMVRVPLLEGESATDSSVVLDGKEAIVSLGRDDVQAQFTSAIEPQESLTLTATTRARTSEVWKLWCTPIWRCEISGLDPVAHLQSMKWRPVFRPWPSESLSLRFEKPAAADGSSVTVDQANLLLRPGVRMLQAELRLSIRTSSGAAETWTLPDDAEIQSLSVAGQERPVHLEQAQQQERALRVTLAPGLQEVVVRWQQPLGINLAFRAPQVRLGNPIANAKVTVSVPSDRWLLFAVGPAWGVAVLFWPYLLLMLFVGLVLARTGYGPLRLVDWWLLGLGLTQIDSFGALIVVGWFLAFEHRKRVDLSPGPFDLRQLFLVGYTVLALLCLYSAVHAGLLMNPEMQVHTLDGNLARPFFERADRASTPLTWYVDRTAGALPAPIVYSVPVWVYHLLMLSWALWLAYRLVSWARWGFASFGHGGFWKTTVNSLSKSPNGGPRGPGSGPQGLGPQGAGSTGVPAEGDLTSQESSEASTKLTEHVLSKSGVLMTPRVGWIHHPEEHAQGREDSTTHSHAQQRIDSANHDVHEGQQTPKKEVEEVVRESSDDTPLGSRDDG